MKILEFMSFDPSWFLTPSGLLITGGVVLLLIALIVFIATSKKDKGNAKVDPTVEGSIPLVEGPTGDVNQMNQPVAMNNMVNDPMMNNQPINNIPDMNSAINPMPQMVPSMDMNQNPTVMPAMPEVNQAPVQVPNVNMAPAMDPMVNMATPVEQANVVSSVAPTMPVNNQEVIPVIDNQNVAPAPVIDFGNVQPQVVNNPIPATPAPVVEPTPVMNNNIYGGNNPADINNRPIYGGANPLENTASIPTVSSHTAYNGEPIIPNSVVEEVKVMDSAPISQVNQAAVMNNQQATPISANDIFGQVPTASSVEIQQPTPVVEQPQVMPTIAEPTPVNSVNQVNQNNTIETLDF